MNAIRLVVSLFLIIALSGCASGLRKPESTTGLPMPELTAPPNKERGYQDSRTLAAHNLTIKGHALLEKGDLDGSIRLLERAVGLNPSDGPGYYFLAEAWLAKGDLDLARRFNKLAAIYLRREPSWARRAADQMRRIETP